MSQEYTEDKDITLTPMSSGRRLLESLLILIALFAVYLMVSLVSFNPSDPSWSQTAWHEPIHNLGGGVGAWLADTLLFIFGVMAYAIPPVIIGLCWIAHRYHDAKQDSIDCFAIGLRLIGVLSLVVTTCGLASLNADDIWYFASGGVIGSVVSSAITQWFNPAVGPLILLFVWAAGITLYTGWSWLTIAEKLGSGIMRLLTFITGRRQVEDHWQEDDYEESDVAYIDEPDPAKLSLKGHRLFSKGLKSKTTSTADLPEAELHADPLLAPRLSVTDAHQEYDPLLAPLPYSQQTAVSETAAVTSVNHHHEQQVSTPSSQPVTEAEPTPVQDAPASQTTRVLQPSIAPAAVEPTVPHWPAPHPELQPTVAAAELDPSYTLTAVTVGGNITGAATKHLSPFAAAASMGKLSKPNLTPGKNSVSGGATSQVKQGLGPELPRPNPVRIPTRRELASQGIKFSAQRQADERSRESLASDVDQSPLSKPPAGQPPVTRYAHEQVVENSADTDEQLQQSLAQAFSNAQQQRYAATSDSEPVLDLSALAFSPMEDLVEGTPSEPLFTIAPNEPVAAEADATWQQTPSEPTAAFQPSVVASAPPELEEPVQDSLFHPFLVRHEKPLVKPTTPLPTLDLLTEPPAEEQPVDMFALEQTGRLVEARLADFRIKADVVGICPGPVITRFELDLAPGVKASRISNLSTDLARSLSALAVRVVEVIPGKPYVGLELPNQHRQTVYLREVLDCAAFRDNPSPLSVVLGKDISGEPVVADLAKMPHLLVAGTTGSGKSVGVNAMILSILYKATPDEVRFIMIDPKMLELSVYEGIPHLLTEVVTDMKDAANALRWSVMEMERRYKLMSALGVRNLAGYNEKIEQAAAMGRPIPDPFWKPGDSMAMSPPVLEKLPYIVVMVDEFADLMMAVGKKVEELIARLAQKARAAGIHLVLATQRPSVDVITGLIKANIPTRIAFTVSSKIDSRTILDQGGAESLLGMGDMLYVPPNTSMPVRIHGAFVRDQEVHAVVQDWKARGRPQYIDSITAGDGGEGAANGIDGGGEELDSLFDQAVVFVVEKRRASISGVQRQFRIGYNRAARIIEQMEAQGIVSEPGHNGNREVLAPPPHEM